MSVHVFASEPEGYRVVQFTTDGDFVLYWGDRAERQHLGLPGAAATDPQGGVWVTDAVNSRIMRFSPPAAPPAAQPSPNSMKCFWVFRIFWVYR